MVCIFGGGGDKGEKSSFTNFGGSGGSSSDSESGGGGDQNGGAVVGSWKQVASNEPRAGLESFNWRQKLMNHEETSRRLGEQ